MEGLLTAQGYGSKCLIMHADGLFLFISIAQRVAMVLNAIKNLCKLVSKGYSFLVCKALSDAAKIVNCQNMDEMKWSSACVRVDTTGRLVKELQLNKGI